MVNPAHVHAPTSPQTKIHQVPTDALLITVLRARVVELGMEDSPLPIGWQIWLSQNPPEHQSASLKDQFALHDVMAVEGYTICTGVLAEEDRSIFPSAPGLVVFDLSNGCLLDEKRMAEDLTRWTAIVEAMPAVRIYRPFLMFCYWAAAGEEIDPDVLSAEVHKDFVSERTSSLNAVGTKVCVMRPHLSVEQLVPVLERMRLDWRPSPILILSGSDYVNHLTDHCSSFTQTIIAWLSDPNDFALLLPMLIECVNAIPKALEPVLSEPAPATVPLPVPPHRAVTSSPEENLSALEQYLLRLGMGRHVRIRSRLLKWTETDSNLKTPPLATIFDLIIQEFGSTLGFLLEVKAELHGQDRRAACQEEYKRLLALVEEKNMTTLVILSKGAYHPSRRTVANSAKSLTGARSSLPGATVEPDSLLSEASSSWQKSFAALQAALDTSRRTLC